MDLLLGVGLYLLAGIIASIISIRTSDEDLLDRSGFWAAFIIYTCGWIIFVPLGFFGKFIRWACTVGKNKYK